MSKVTENTLRILKEVLDERGKPLERLEAKCQYEHMSTTAVIQEWGDPKKWRDE